ncbi:heat shock protein Hsp90 [Backusella circina FSU 941]|nr:heat shock protein Hsp90 [Backusella circina FSU 941]
MHLIINSLYKTREVFLREIISNAADALDKIRFESLTDSSALKSNPDLRISIAADKENNALVITDTGIGMTRQQLKENLGTIAKSGTSEFLAKMEKNKDSAITQIGQFGVGFYSVFLVADKVTVASKSNDDPDQNIWMSQAVNDFVIAKDPRGNTLGRGTQITLHLKEEAKRFLDEKNLAELVKRYSEFINFPIYMWSEKTETVEVEEEQKDELDDDIVEEDISADKEEKKKKTETRTVHSWEHVNTQKPIWMRDAKEVTAEEHAQFYKSMTKDHQDPVSWSQNKGEGEFEFRSLLYIPSGVADKFFQNLQQGLTNKSIRLFVKRVFISDEFDLLPKWLSFLKGIVDADDMPLNVSRETLQKHRNLRIITRHLIKKALDMFTQLAANDKDKYTKFLSQYSSVLKYGAMEDQTYRKKIVSLLRFSSSYDSSPFSTSLDEYISRAKANQKSLYFMTGSSNSEIEQSPFIESLLARGYEVLYFTDPVDEHFVENIPGYNAKMFVNIAKADLEFPEDDQIDLESKKELEKKFQPLADWLTNLLSETIEKVTISKRLTTSPLAVVVPKFGLSGHAQRILDAQGANYKNPQMDYMLDAMRKQKKTLEINPNHPLITNLLEAVQLDDIPEETTELIKMLYETTSIKSGFPLKDMNQFATRVENLIRKDLGVSLTEQAKVEVKQAADKSDEERLADEALLDTNVILEEEADDGIDHDEL